MPNGLSLNINLSNIKTKKIFKWLKSKKIQDLEMLKTFNCGVGFCLITEEKNIKKIQNIFENKYKPYPIGFISRDRSKIKLFGKIKW